MNIQLNVQLKTLDGEPLKKDAEGEACWDVRSIIIQSLLSTHADYTPTGEQKLSDYRLANSVKDAVLDLDLKSEEVVHIKECVCRMFNTLVYGQMCDLLEKVEEPASLA
jgi:hypothetical protein